MKQNVVRVATTAGAVAAAGIAAVVMKHRHDDHQLSALAEENPFGSVRGESRYISSSDDLALHAEIDDGPQPTVVFVHGWLCDIDTWHFQRLALRDEVRMVFVDLRSHGKSARSYAQNSSLDVMADDLSRVIDEIVPTGPIVLVGHSMGGMAIMKFAATHSEMFGSRVVGVVLIGTSSGRLMKRSPVLPLVAAAAQFSAPLLDWGRNLNSLTVIKKWAVGPRASESAAAMAHKMILRAPTQTVLDFFPNFVDLDLGEGLGTISKVRTTVVCGTRDRITPFSHSKWLTKSIDGAELVTVNDSGHMVMLEEPEQVTEAIERVLKDVS